MTSHGDIVTKEGRFVKEGKETDAAIPGDPSPGTERSTAPFSAASLSYAADNVIARHVDKKRPGRAPFGRGISSSRLLA